MYPTRARGWDIENQRWVYGYYENIPVGIGQPIELIHEFMDWGLSAAHRVAAGSCGMFTGKQDANGKDIYEGDILDYFSLTKIVGWDNENSMWAFKRTLDEKSKYVQQLATVDLQKSHIVGNVYQNPERVAKI